MTTKDLIKGQTYHYTAGNEWVKVVYKYETINGYMFSDGDDNNVLNSQDVERYIEEL